MAVSEGQVWEAVERHMGGAFVWGQADCCAAPCAVFADLHGIDPMEDLRTAYARPRQARRILQRGGGLVALASRLAQASGLVPRPPKPGHIGVISHAGGESLAICLGAAGWAGKGAEGVVIVPCATHSWGLA